MNKLSLYKTLFAGRQDCYGTIGSNSKGAAVKEPLTDNVLWAHLTGKKRIGVYPLVDDRCRFAVIDLDKDDLSLALAVLKRLKHYGLPACIERSKGKGYHVWLFFDGWILASKARLVLKMVLDELDLDIEIFPKQDEANNGFGNYIYLPLFNFKNHNGRTVFLSEQGEAYPDQIAFLEEVQLIPESTMDKIIEMNSLDQKSSQSKTESVDDNSKQHEYGKEPITEILKNCAYLDKLRWDGKEVQHLDHDKRIHFANVFLPLPGGREWLIDFFSCLSDFDLKNTEYQLSSLKGKPTLCSTMCKEQCETIKGRGGKSPFAFAVKGMGQFIRTGNTEVPLKGAHPVFPAEVLTGAAGTFAKAYSQYLEAPPEFLFMSYLTCLGSIIGDKITLESQIEPQPRLYTILIGESADDRKSTAADQTLKFFNWFSHRIAKSATDAELAVCYGVGSAEGLATRLQKNSKLLLFVDELKSLVQKMKGEGSILLPCINTLFESNCFHSATKKHSINLDNVYLSLIGCCTVETYRTMFTSQFLDIGLINRFFVVLGKGKRRFAIPQTIPTPQKSKLYEDLDRVIKLAFSLAEKQAYAMPIEQNVLKLFEEWYFNTPRSIFTKRLDTYGHRLMPLLAINEGKTTIDIAIVEAAIKLLNYELEVRKYADPVDAETRIAKIEEQIRRALDRGTHKRRDLERACNKARYGNYLWSWAIDNLIKAEEISYDSKTKIYSRSDSEGEVCPPENHQGMMWEGLYDGNRA